MIEINNESAIDVDETLVIEACRHGVIGAFPAPNARPLEVLDAWMARIAAALVEIRRAGAFFPAAPELPLMLLFFGIAGSLGHMGFKLYATRGTAAFLKGHGIEPKLDYSYKGHWRIYVVDPWNNRLEFIEPLPEGHVQLGADAAVLGDS